MFAVNKNMKLDENLNMKMRKKSVWKLKTQQSAQNILFISVTALQHIKVHLNLNVEISEADI